MFSFTQPLSRGHAATRGLVAAVLGGVFLVWPGITIGTVVALLAISAFAHSAISVGRMFAPASRAATARCSGSGRSSSSPRPSSRSRIRARPPRR